MQFISHSLLVVILIISGGCALFGPSIYEEKTSPRATTDAFAAMKKAEIKPAIERSRSTYDKTINTKSKSREALNLVRLLTHPDNGNQDYSQALSYFDRYLELQPVARESLELQIFRQTLENLVETGKELDLCKTRHTSTSPEKDAAIRKLQSSNSELRNGIKALEQSNEKLRLTLEKLKDIDLTAEEKRRRYK